MTYSQMIDLKNDLSKLKEALLMSSSGEPFMMTELLQKWIIHIETELNDAAKEADDE